MKRKVIQIMVMLSLELSLIGDLSNSVKAAQVTENDLLEDFQESSDIGEYVFELEDETEINVYDANEYLEDVERLEIFSNTINDGVVDVIEQYNGIYYRYVEDTDSYVVIGGIENLETAEILSTVEGKSVTAIKSFAFSECSDLRKVTIPDSITSIYMCAFKNCVNLEQVVMPDRVTYMEHGIFEDCSSLREIKLPTSLTVITGDFFAGCKSLSTINIPSSVTSIGAYAFAGCESLKQIELPQNLQSLGWNVFNNTGLSNIKLPESLCEIGQGAFANCGNLESIEIPEGVVTIGNNLFANCENLKKITLPNSISEIPSEMFLNCTSLKTVNIPRGVQKIGNDIFLGCDNLVEVTVDSQNQTVKMSQGMLYADTELKWCEKGKSGRVVVDSGTEIITMHAFLDCKNIEEIVLPESIYSIGSEAFKNCISLQSMVVPPKAAINTHIFSGCSGLKTVTISEGVSSVDFDAFEGCDSLTEINIPASVTKILVNGAKTNHNNVERINVDSNNNYYRSIDGILYNKGLTEVLRCPEKKASVILPENVEKIGDDAFLNCDLLETIRFSANVTTMYYNSFEGCRNLKSIEVDENNTAFTSINGVLYDKDVTKLISYPGGLTDVPIAENISIIGHWALSIHPNLESIIIPNGVTTIESCAFLNCEKLYSVYIPSSVTYIVGGAFDGCSQLVIKCEKDSYAEQFAKYYRIAYNIVSSHSHKYNSEITKSPTCTEKGIRTYSCQECDSSYTEEMPMTAHTYEKVTEEDGTIVEKCSVCGKINSDANSREDSTEDAEEEINSEGDSTEDVEQEIKVKNIKLSAPSAKLAAGKKVKLVATITPANATNTSLKWSTSNKKYATVDQKGNVSLKAAGSGKKVTITAVAKDGSNKKATYKITIMKHAVKSIKIKASTKNVKAGKSLQLKTAVKTTGKKVNKTLVWSSSNIRYATVNKKGKVKTKKAGKGKTVTITAMSTDGTNKKAKVKIKIK